MMHLYSGDKWDPTVYTVKDNNLRINIYKLVDEGGKSKVVHRNLILYISFLPIEPPQDDEDIQLSPENVEAESPMSELSEEGSSDDGMEHGCLMDRMKVKVKESDYSTQSRRSVSEQDPSKKEVH